MGTLASAMTDDREQWMDTLFKSTIISSVLLSFN